MERKLQVYLGDLSYTNSVSNVDSAIPLNIAYLASYAGERFGNTCEFHLFKDPKKLIDLVKVSPPDVIGLSNFYWHRNLNLAVAEIVKTISPQTIVVIGGPNIDTDPLVQYEVHQSYLGNCDYLVSGEGEIPFCNILETKLSGNFRKIEAIEGVVSFDGSRRIYGGDVADPELNTISSPYLSGLLDEFLGPQYTPMIQFSRTCPYKCSFCVSARPGKVRAYSLDQQKEEILYLATKYKEHTYATLMIIDENFGINKNDREIAEFVVESYQQTGYPKRLDVYLNKKFNDKTRTIAETFSKLPEFDYVLPFQTLTPKSLEMVRRKNIRMGELDEIQQWAEKHQLVVSTEFISGLPGDSVEGIMHCIDVCFHKDINLSIAGLLMFPGIELYRKDERDKYQIKTKYRPTYIPSFMILEEKKIVEFEEVVVESTSMTEDDYFELRKLSLIAYAMGHVRLYRPVLRFLVENDIQISELFKKLMNSRDEHCVDVNHGKFIADFESAMSGELYDTESEYETGMGKKLFEKEDYPTKLNVLFSSRLVYAEKWLPFWFRRVFEGVFLAEKAQIFQDLVSISESEWIDIYAPERRKQITINMLTIKHLNNIEMESIDDSEDDHLVSLDMNDDRYDALIQFRSEYVGDNNFPYLVLENFRKNGAVNLRYDVSYINDNNYDSMVFPNTFESKPIRNWKM